MWSQRIPLIVVAAVGTAISSYLGLFPLDVIDHVWKPFFGNGSRKILTSKTSRVLPLPDAVLGARSYFADGVTGAIGGEERWRRLWIVITFILAVGPLGATSIILVILQPVITFRSSARISGCSFVSSSTTGMKSVTVPDSVSNVVRNTFIRFTYCCSTSYDPPDGSRSDRLRQSPRWR